MPSVLVCGLGAMGGALAARLLETGIDVQGYDINDAAVQRFVDCGGKPCGSLDTVPEFDIIITSLPNDNILQTFIDKEIHDRIQRHQTLIEMSTVRPQTVVIITKQLEGRAKATIDSPVSGGPIEATKGTLSLFVGAKAALEVDVEAVLSKVGNIMLVGDVGNGKQLKLLNNMISLSNNAIVAEAFQFGQEMGLDLETMYRTLHVSGAASKMLTKRIPFAINDDFTARFSVDLAEKDTGLALEWAHQGGHPTPLLANVHQRYEAARRQGFGKEDIMSLIKLDRKAMNPPSESLR